MTFNLPTFRHSTNSNDWRKIEIFDNFFDDINSLLADPMFGKGKKLVTPKIDIFEDESGYHLEAELPGIKEKDIQVDNHILSIKAKQEEKIENKDKNYYRRERYYGEFQRSIHLPNNINPEKIAADFKHGILHITIPKTGKGTAKKVALKANGKSEPKTISQKPIVKKTTPKPKLKTKK
ncbi:MAG: Hsp20/alpha crystallin family protein [Candidatus Rickettsia vulgarisii]